MRALLCVFLLGCGEAFSAVSAPELADDAGIDSYAKDVEAESWSDHWTAAGVDAIAVDDVLEELQGDELDPPDTYVSTPQVDATSVDASVDGPALCCWIDWNPNGGCCPAPNDPTCAYACGANVGCPATVCAVGGCSGAVKACP